MDAGHTEATDKCVSRRQQCPLLYLMHFLQHGVDSPLQTLESVSFSWIWELLTAVLCS